jgi:hypothetical protein
MIRKKTGEGSKERFTKERRKFYQIIRDLYDDGFTVKQICLKIDKGYGFVKSCLNDLSIEPKEQISRKNSERHKREREKYREQIFKFFNTGCTVNTIAKKIGRSRSFIKTVLLENGFNSLSISEGNKRSALFLSKERRKERAKSALKVNINKFYPRESTQQAALKNQASGFYIGVGESEICNFMAEKKIDFIPQMAWNGYNIDIMVGNLAVEVHCVATNPFYITRNIKKTVELMSSGINVVFVWVRPKNKTISIKTLNYIVELSKLSSQNPTAVGQHWVIRGDGELVSDTQRYFDDIASVLSTYYAFNVS